MGQILVCWELSLPVAGGWNDVVLEEPSKPKHEICLQPCCSLSQ